MVSGFDEETTRLVEAVLDGAEEKLGMDPVVLDVHEFVDAFDALIVTAGRNDRHVRTVAEEVERFVALHTGLRPLRVEGMSGGEWVAIDYGSVIVHVFDQTTREYYDLEHLWSAAPAHRRAQRPISDS